MTPDASRALRPDARVRRDLPLVCGTLIVTLLSACAVAAPLLTRLAGFSPYEQVAPRDATPPTAPDRDHPLGTDAMGRDQLSRLLHGARISLFVAVAAEIVALLLGTTVGALAGWMGGWVDAVLMRAVDLLLALPGPLLALAITAAVPEPETAPLLRRFPEPSLAIVLIVLGVLGWAGIARLVRAEVLRLREEEYARAARAAGATGARIVVRHLLPNALGPLLVVATLGTGGNILMEAWLSFLGVGARPPLPSWGTMAAEGQAYLVTRPWVCLAPGLAILTAVLGFNLMGDAVRDRMDPRRRSIPA